MTGFIRSLLSALFLGLVGATNFAAAQSAPPAELSALDRKLAALPSFEPWRDLSLIWLLNGTAWRPVAAAGLSDDEAARLPSLSLRGGSLAVLPGAGDEIDYPGAGLCMQTSAAAGAKRAVMASVSPTLVEPLTKRRQGARFLEGEFEASVREAGPPQSACLKNEPLARRLTKIKSYELRDIGASTDERLWDAGHVHQLRFSAPGEREPDLIYERDRQYDIISRYSWKFITIDGQDVRDIHNKEWDKFDFGQGDAVSGLTVDRAGTVHIWGICNRNTAKLANSGAETWQIVSFFSTAASCGHAAVMEDAIHTMLRNSPRLHLEQGTGNPTLVGKSAAGETRLVGMPRPTLPIGRWRLVEIQSVQLRDDPWHTGGLWGDQSVVITDSPSVILETTPEALLVDTPCGKRKVELFDSSGDSMLVLNRSEANNSGCASALSQRVSTFFGGRRSNEPFVVHGILWLGYFRLQQRDQYARNTFVFERLE